MDNYFINIPLFTSIRELGIGGCGTTWQGSKKFPTVFAILNASIRTRLVWNTVQGEVVDDVLALIWMDNNFVLLLITIHQLKGAHNYVPWRHRRPGISSINLNVVRPVFQDQHTRMLLIPVIIDMYNQYMSGVDIADQRRSYRPTQLFVNCNWLPLILWCLDTAIVNAIILYRITNITTGAPAKNIMNHRKIREKLYQQLIQEGSASLRQQCTSNANVVTWKHQTPAIPTKTSLPSKHHPPETNKKGQEPNKKKGYWAYCCWVRAQERRNGKNNMGICEGVLSENGQLPRKLKL